MIDLAVKRLPDAIVGPLYLVLFAALAVAAPPGRQTGGPGPCRGGRGTPVAGYFVLAFISPAGLGLGDVKLAGVLGGFLGWLGWSQVLFGTLAAFALNAVVALAPSRDGPGDQEDGVPVRAPHGGGRRARRRLRHQVWAW